VSVPSITSRPPKKRTAAIETDGRKYSPGRYVASTRAWRITPSRTARALSRNLARTSSSRPKACTISMPTTASSDASVTSAFSCWTSREIGCTRRANIHVRTPTAGMAIPAYSVSRGFTSRSTTATPTIIISDCAPCTMPQPMK
jgi:hypothetical protein